MTQAMASYLSLCGNELVNAARLKAYVDNGIAPSGFSITAKGCEGLVDILPCIGSDEPVGGYQLPELDDAIWYDPAVPESKNFAGLLVTSVVMSSPYSRTTTDNIGNGQSLGRLKLKGRTIVVHGFLIGKTCCAVQYGFRWLTSALGESPCTSGGCGGCEIDFLDCCPNISGEDECITTTDEFGNHQVYTRSSEYTEYQRGSDFFRKMHGAGVISGPEVISSKGGSCGCGSGAMTEVEFVLSTSSPYINDFGTVLLDASTPPPCSTATCTITWIKSDECVTDDGSCPEAPADCLEDPFCPLPLLPPSAAPVNANGCGCTPMAEVRTCSPAQPARIWGDSTLNVEVYAGSTDLRNMAIRVWQNPAGVDCGDRDSFDDCDACTTLFVTFVPAGGTLTLSGEERTVTVACNGAVRNASQNVTDITGQPFDWPDLTCFTACVCVVWACESTAPDAHVTITRIERDL